MKVPIFIQKKWALILFFIFLAAFRLSLISKGHCFDDDERRYFYALWFWDNVFRGQFFNGFACLFAAQCRPGFVLINLLPAALLIMLEDFNFISTANLHFFDLPSFLNVLITLINSAVFYGILRFIVPYRYLALMGTAVYSLLVNTNVYIRHLFPYDYSLLFFLMAIFIILKQNSMGFLRSRFLLVSGVLSALGALIYPAYYAMALIIVFYLAVSTRFNLKALAFYLCGFLSLIYTFELSSQLLRRPYFFQCKVLSDTVTHGSFDEGFLFIIRYIKEVEGMIGIVLFVLFIIYFIYFLARDRGPCRWLMVPAILMYSIYAILGVFFSKMVFYGRLLHMYFPFLVLTAVRVLSLIQRKIYKIGAISILLLAAIVSFVSFSRAYIGLSYPQDVYFQYLSQIPKNKVLWLISGEKVNPFVYRNYSAVALNLRSYFEVKENYVDPTPPADMTTVAAYPHPLNFPSYTFENYAPEERKMLKERKYQMKIYLTPQARNDLENQNIRRDSLDSFLYKVSHYNSNK